jgi:hypothetical protein
MHEGRDGSGSDMSKYLTINNFAGLVTAYGQLGSPPGSFSQADNVDFPNDKMAAKRNGLFANGAPFGIPASMFYSDPIGGPIVNYAVDTTSTQASLLSAAYLGSVALPGSLTAINTVTTRMKCAVMRGNTYCTTQNGVVRVEKDLNAWWAGSPRIATMGHGLNSASATGWLANNSTVAYRTVLVQYDSDGIPMRGSPSSQVLYKNVSGSAANVSLPVIASSNVIWAVNGGGARLDPSNIRRIDVEVYRTAQSSTGTPGDEMQLCYRKTLSAAEKDGSSNISGFVDSCPDAALGAYLYTNAISGGDTVSGGMSVGLVARNDMPPIATDVAVFANRLWYSGLTVPQEIVISIVSPGTSGSALKTGDTLTVGGVPVTITVDTSGSLVDNIRATAQLVAGAIDTALQSSISAEYVGNTSSPGTAGQIRIFARQPSLGAFTVQVTGGGSGSAFIPDLTNAVSSGRDDWLGGIAYSKELQADAVPPSNYVRVGRGDFPVKRIIPTRDSLFIFTDEGVWRLTGSDPSSFSIEKFDTTFTLLARDSVVVLDDAIYAWGNEGIARITTSGVQLIDATIRDIVSAHRAADVSKAFAVEDRVTKRVLFFVPNHSSDACALGMVSNRALVYNAAGSMGATSYSAAVLGRWSRYDYGAASAKTCACAQGPARSNQVILGGADDGAGSTTAGTELDGPGYTRAAGSGHLAVFFFLDKYGALSDTTNAGATAPISSTLRWTCATPDPQMSAQWQELDAFFAPNDNISAFGSPSAMAFGFDTDTATAEQVVSWAQPAPPSANVDVARVMVPRDASRGARMVVRMTHSVAGEYFSVDGFGLYYESTGREVAR